MFLLQGLTTSFVERIKRIYSCEYQIQQTKEGDACVSAPTCSTGERTTLIETKLSLDNVTPGQSAHDVQRTVLKVHHKYTLIMSERSPIRAGPFSVDFVWDVLPLSRWVYSRCSGSRTTNIRAID